MKDQQEQQGELGAAATLFDSDLADKPKEPGRPEIGDRFGLSTPAYMAPEQLGGQKVSAHSDQFNFCVALYGSQPRVPNPATSRVF